MNRTVAVAGLVILWVLALGVLMYWATSRDRYRGVRRMHKTKIRVDERTYHLPPATSLRLTPTAAERSRIDRKAKELGLIPKLPQHAKWTMGGETTRIRPDGK